MTFIAAYVSTGQQIHRHELCPSMLLSEMQLILQIDTTDVRSFLVDQATVARDVMMAAHAVPTI